MSFRIWFRRWIALFLKLFSVGAQRHKSEAARERESARRKEKKREKKHGAAKKANRKARTQNARIAAALFEFFAHSLCILLLPFGLLDWGYQSAKLKKAARRARTKTASTRAEGHSEKAPKEGAAPAQRQAPAREGTQAPAPPLAEVAAPKKEKAEKSPKAPSTHDMEADESTPRSTPASASDRYIRKRLTLSDFHACDPSARRSLTVGTRLDFAADPDTAHEKNAVVLLRCGDRVGYLAPQDQTAFAACLRLKQNIYGIVTAVKEENGQTVYEIEAWFASQKRE
ncbi:MAG: hypothetical protein IJZ24_07030 [Clostridia bacterium]|nr:hypothetical protein [Clostridia bacterium]